MEQEIQFNENGQEMLNEAWTNYMQLVTTISRLHGVRPKDLDFYVLKEDRSGLRLKMAVVPIDQSESA